ncbi:hypothetical protein GE061_000875 [Apolygus lucorum]|uniref:Nucleoplasmin core domain-containing protein n=1 Tax=Apolygus lucorum TaxID=248454 RepID=A0A8S9Y5H5_APOLU|nr:hypothetical protein GE061_000875 [Apolygus lucorum]
MRGERYGRSFTLSTGNLSVEFVSEKSGLVELSNLPVCLPVFVGNMALQPAGIKPSVSDKPCKPEETTVVPQVVEEVVEQSPPEDELSTDGESTSSEDSTSSDEEKDPEMKSPKFGTPSGGPSPKRKRKPPSWLKDYVTSGSSGGPKKCLDMNSMMALSADLRFNGDS